MDELAPFFATAAFALYVATLTWIAISDLWRFRIPNLANAVLIFLFIPTALLLPQDVDWLAHGGAALLVFAVTLIPYLLGWLGAGDVKMFTALAFWTGFALLFEMFFLVALAGGGLAAVLMLLRFLAPRFCPSPGLPEGAAWPRVLNKGAKLPYGAAISAGALVLGPHIPQFAPLFS